MLAGYDLHLKQREAAFQREQAAEEARIAQIEDRFKLFIDTAHQVGFTLGDTASDYSEQINDIVDYVAEKAAEALDADPGDPDTRVAMKMIMDAAEYGLKRAREGQGIICKAGAS